MRSAAMGLVLWLVACDGSYRVVIHVPGEAARVERVEVSVIASCGDIAWMGALPDETVRTVVATPAHARSVGKLPAGQYGLYARVWERGCILFAAGCTQIDVHGDGDGDLDVVVTNLQVPLGCYVGSRCEDEQCEPIQGCGEGCSDDQVCRGGECVDAQSDQDGDGYVAAGDCDDLDEDIVPGIASPCASSCGIGLRTCLSDGSWTDCSAPEDCDCTDGQVRQEPCGRCGTSERRCGDDRRWGEAGPCAGEGECQTGERSEEPCEPCGTKELVCSDGCDWVAGKCARSPEADQDRDGFDSAACGGGDCDDANVEVHPGAADGWEIETVDTGSGREPSLAIDADGAVHIAYRGYDLSHAVDDGTGWMLETVDTGAADATGGTPSLAVGADGSLHIAYYDYASYRLRYATDVGLGWVIEILNPNGAGGFPSLALGTDARVRIAFYDWIMGSGTLRYATHEGVGWSLEQVDPFRGLNPSLVLGPMDRPHVAYHVENYADLHYAVNDGNGWMIEMVDSAGDTGLTPSLALSNGDTVHVAYYDRTNGDLRYAVNDGAGWMIETVDSVGDTGLTPSLALSNGDTVHIAYYDETNGDLRYAVNDGAGWAFETLDSQGDTGIDPSLALGADGSLHIAYYDISLYDLRYAFLDTVDQDCDGLLSE